jgi:trk system potassium uptake protein TrkH
VIDLRPVLFLTGILVMLLGAAMLIPAAADAFADNPDWRVFLASSAATLFIGGALVLTNRSPFHDISIRQAFLLTTVAWIVIAALGALPFSFADFGLSYTDAYFEAMSGITTTGSTVMTGLDSAPPGILLWRALLQWLGGLGIIAMGIIILPLLQVGGMQLFQMESSDRSDKAFPRTVQVAAATTLIYLVLSMLCFSGYWAAGMTPFEAAAHTMTTISTAGYSTSDASIGHFDSVAVESIAIVFMLIGSLPFVLYLETVRRRWGAVGGDSQVRWFVGMIVFWIAVMTVWRWNIGDVDFPRALRESAFNIVSILTGTGYATADYNGWGGFAIAVFFVIMFIGGCAGSTTCSIKVFRYQVAFAAIRVALRRLWQPNGVFVPYYNKKPLQPAVIDAVLVFFVLFTAAFAAIAMILFALGLDFLTAISGAATAICNVGPALGDIIGPAGNFQTLPDTAKWVLSAGMLLGRLELLTVLVLFTPGFWRG